MLSFTTTFTIIIALQTAANYLVDDVAAVPSSLNATEFSARILANCRYKKKVHIPEPWSYGDKLALSAKQ